MAKRKLKKNRKRKSDSKILVKVMVLKGLRTAVCIEPLTSRYIGQEFEIRNFLLRTTDGIGPFIGKHNLGKISSNEKSITITNKVVKSLSEYK